VILDDRRALLGDALGFAQLDGAHHPALTMLRRWLDTWNGVGLVMMRRTTLLLTFTFALAGLAALLRGGLGRAGSIGSRGLAAELASRTAQELLGRSRGQNHDPHSRPEPWPVGRAQSAGRDAGCVIFPPFRPGYPTRYSAAPRWIAPPSGAGEEPGSGQNHWTAGPRT
jgi:hypothetical protein